MIMQIDIGSKKKIFVYFLLLKYILKKIKNTQIIWVLGISFGWVYFTLPKLIIQDFWVQMYESELIEIYS
jgi:hypothetical protein